MYSVLHFLYMWHTVFININVRSYSTTLYAGSQGQNVRDKGMGICCHRCKWKYIYTVHLCSIWKLSDVGSIVLCPAYKGGGMSLFMLYMYHVWHVLYMCMCVRTSIIYPKVGLGWVACSCTQIWHHFKKSIWGFLLQSNVVFVVPPWHAWEINLALARPN